MLFVCFVGEPAGAGYIPDDRDPFSISAGRWDGPAEWDDVVGWRGNFLHS